MKSRILVVDDEKSMLEFLKILLEKEGFEVLSAENGKLGIEILKKENIDLVITDIKMPQATGLSVLKSAQEKNPYLPVVMITAYGSTQGAVEAMKRGAYDYITKPFKIDNIKLVVRNALEKKRLADENIFLKEELKNKNQFSRIIGKNKKIQEIFEIIKKISDTPNTVLITGESGTGKELIARAIHQNSSRKDKPFVSISCAALPEQLLENELFGHEKGAFTGADFLKQGLMEVAGGGTFFLDEIGTAPLSIQTKLLRVLQEREFRRLGGTKDVKIDIRFISATNQNLSEAVSKGLFREDLYYRVNVIKLALPPLRERRDDIPLLISHFLERLSLINRKEIKGVSPEVLKVFERYNWPGNIREMENVLERAVILENTDTIQLESISEEVRNYAGKENYQSLEIPSHGLDLENILDNLEKELLRKALDKSEGTLGKAAKMLNLSFRSLRYRLSKHKLRDMKDEEDKENKENK